MCQDKNTLTCGSSDPPSSCQFTRSPYQAKDGTNRRQTRGRATTNIGSEVQQCQKCQKCPRFFKQEITQQKNQRKFQSMAGVEPSTSQSAAECTPVGCESHNSMKVVFSSKLQLLLNPPNLQNIRISSIYLV